LRAADRANRREKLEAPLARALRLDGSVRRSECVHIGDSRTGVPAARAACDFIHCHRGLRSVVSCFPGKRTCRDHLHGVSTCRKTQPVFQNVSSVRWFRSPTRSGGRFQKNANWGRHPSITDCRRCSRRCRSASRHLRFRRSHPRNRSIARSGCTECGPDAQDRRPKSTMPIAIISGKAYCPIIRRPGCRVYRRNQRPMMSRGSPRRDRAAW